MQLNLTSRKTVQGLGLVEVMVAVLILAIGVLGAAALQATMLRNTQSAYERATAVTLAYSILDSIRVNRAAKASYDDVNICGVAEPSKTGLVQADLERWVANIRDNFGSGANVCGKIDVKSNTVEVTVQWDDSRATEGSNPQKLVLESAL